MSVVVPAPAQPAVAELLMPARAIAKLARARTQATEADRRVSEDMIERTRQADLFRVLQPRTFPHQSQLGFDRQHVWAASARSGAQGAILSRRDLDVTDFERSVLDEIACYLTEWC